MSIIKEKYSDKRINLIYQMLLNEKEVEHPKDYDISVDDLKVVSRTNNPEKFYNHEEFIQDDTKVVTICLYMGSSRRCTRYLLLLKEEEVTQQQALAGIEKSVDDKLIQERRKWDYDLLKKENEQLHEQLGEAEEFSEILQKRLSELTIQKESTSNKLTETIINFAGAYIANKPNVFNGIPIIGDLLSSGHNKQVPKKNENDNEEISCSFEHKKTAKTFTGEITEGDLEELKIALIPFFKPEFIDRVGNIIQHLYMHNPFINQTIKVIEHAIDNAEPEIKAA